MDSPDFMGALGLEAQVTNFVFLGEAGCGKSELAINFARCLREHRSGEVHFFDLDMTKPLFRSRDQRAAFAQTGIQLHFEEQFMDAPTATGGVNRLLRAKDCFTVLDVGGDYIGARAIGGYAPLLNSPNTAVYYVMNPFRPWSMSMEHIDRVLGEILGVCHIPPEALHLVGNPNIGPHTTAEDVRAGCLALEEMVSPYKGFDFFCVWEGLYEQVRVDFARPLLPIALHLTYPWNSAAEEI